MTATTHGQGQGQERNSSSRPNSDDRAVTAAATRVESPLSRASVCVCALCLFKMCVRVCVRWGEESGPGAQLELPSQTGAARGRRRGWFVNAAACELTLVSSIAAARRGTRRTPHRQSRGRAGLCGPHCCPPHRSQVGPGALCLAVIARKTFLASMQSSERR
jgi:hypothetical protein